MSAKAGGMTVRRTDALRLATERGVEVLERELEVHASTETKGGKPAGKPRK